MEAATLLGLPLELRRCIILETLKQGHHKPLILSQQTLDDRVRLRNRFDDNYPIETNIYVRKHKDFIHANALLQTNRRLRQDTLDVIEDTLKTGKVEIPFVLDVMFVKDVGVLPTWMSCPYRPERIEKMQVNFRIFRPDKDVVPESWIPAAQLDDCRRHYGITIEQWTLMVVIVFYAMGRFSGSPRDAIKAGEPSLPEEGLNKLRAEDQPEGVDTYVTAKAPYVVEEMVIRVREFERLADGKVLRRLVEDEPTLSPYYKEGCYNFGRKMFDEGRRYTPGELAEQRRLAGKNCAVELCCAIDHWTRYLVDNCVLNQLRFNQAPIRLYLDAVARNMRTVTWQLGREQVYVIAGGGADRSWEYVFSGHFAAGDVVTAFKMEKKERDPDGNLLHCFRLAKRRMDLGWWDDAYYRTMWQVCNS